jgi:stage II sporulation protein D
VLPQPGRAYRVVVGGDERWMWGPLEITAGAAEHHWQVGAWSTTMAAEGAAAVLDRELGRSVRAWVEPTGTGLFRVKCRWLGTEPADAAPLLASVGFPDAFATSAGGAVRIAGAGASVKASSAVTLHPAGDWPTVVGGRRYRGRFVVRPAGSDLLLVNEIAMEQYLRGVVPVEMGPYVFPELEALKAQAVAARTYTVAHLGDHDDEGWDICDTPACQAYHGAGAEHRLTDRAVVETAGLVATFEGAPIDAMYTSTCGGHTEDAAELFDGRGAPYLRGVACAWDRALRLTGEPDPIPAGDGRAFRADLARRALGLPGGPVAPENLLRPVAALCRGEVRPLPSAFDMDDWSGALLAAGGFDDRGPLAAGVGADRLIRLADLFDLPLSPPDLGDRPREWHLEAAAAVLELRGVITVDRGEAVPHPQGVAIYPRRADRSEPIRQPVPLFSRWNESITGAAVLDVFPGTPLERYRLDDRVLALVVVRSGGGGEADRRSSWRSWRRVKSWDELEASIGQRDLERIEIVRVGRSGRVVELGVIDSAGRRRIIDGFDVRRALDLPETFFEMHMMTDSEGRRSVQFLGRGWGHGVGLCQNGAYGLARSGMGFESILEHYYTGIEVVPWR